jgi:hypothetical protein
VFGWINNHHIRVFLWQGLLSVSENSQTRELEAKKFPYKRRQKKELL